MMIKFRASIIAIRWQLLILVMLPIAASSQSKTEAREMFAQAESHFLYGDYYLANQLYLQLVTPDNENIKHKIGICYINIPDEKEKAVSYLEDAVRNFSYDAKTASFKEKRAPLDAYFFLSKAYLINNEFEKALNTLQTFRDLALKTKARGGMRNPDFIDQQIQACRNAIKYKESPIVFSKETPGPGFNKGSVNDNPAVSFDGNTIAYTERRGITDVIMFAKKESGIWQPPRQFNPITDPGDDCSSCSLNKDGTILFLYKTDNFDGNIYASEYSDDNWTPIKKLNDNINTRFFESHASISADGRKLYFTSNRDGGYGGLDIYVSEKDAAGDWGPAINLGSTINTRYNEDTPFVTLNDSLLYFSSEGHNSMGGYDNFVARREGTAWKAPENIGFPLNTTDDDLFFQPFNNGKNGYYSMPSGYKKKDILYITFETAIQERIYEIRGVYSLSDINVKFGDSYAIHLLDGNSGDTIDVGYPNKFTGQYNFMVAPGNFRLVYTGIGHLQQVVDTAIAPGNPFMHIDIDAVLDRDPDFKGAIPQQVPAKYERVNLSNIPLVDAIDSSILFRNLRVTDIGDTNVPDSDILYYTVQVMALYNPVDVRYFKHVNDIRVMYDPFDKFYRYTTGIFATRDAAYAYRLELVSKGYEDDLFIKKISKY